MNIVANEKAEQSGRNEGGAKVKNSFLVDIEYRRQKTEDESGDQNAEPESEPDKVPDSVENQFESAHRSGGEGVEAGPTQEVEDSRRIMGSSVTKVWQGRNR